jgi:hypothetical protein
LNPPSQKGDIKWLAADVGEVQIRRFVLQQTSHHSISSSAIRSPCRQAQGTIPGL